MKSIAYRVLILVSLTGLLANLSACAGGPASIVIPDSLRAPCQSTVDVSTATTVGDLGQAIVRGDGDLRVCSIQKDAVVAIAEAQNKRWFEFWR